MSKNFFLKNKKGVLNIKASLNSKKLRNINAIRRGVSYLQIFTVVLLVLVISVISVYHQAVRTELSSAVAELEAEYSELLLEENRLKGEIAVLYNNMYLTSQAQRLGMGKAQEYQTEYVSVHSEDTVERNPSRAESLLSSVVGIFNSILEYFIGG